MTFNTPDEIVTEVERLEADLDEALRKTDVGDRQRAGITIHGKLEKAAHAVAEMRRAGVADTAEAADAVRALTKRVLTEIFAIDSDAPRRPDTRPIRVDDDVHGKLLAIRSELGDGATFNDAARKMLGLPPLTGAA